MTAAAVIMEVTEIRGAHVRTNFLAEEPAGEPSLSAQIGLVVCGSDGWCPCGAQAGIGRPPNRTPLNETNPDRIRICDWSRSGDSNPGPTHYECEFAPLRGARRPTTFPLRSLCRKAFSGVLFLPEIGSVRLNQDGYGHFYGHFYGQVHRGAKRAGNWVCWLLSSSSFFLKEERESSSSSISSRTRWERLFRWTITGRLDDSLPVSGACLAGPLAGILEQGKAQDEGCYRHPGLPGPGFYLTLWAKRARIKAAIALSKNSVSTASPPFSCKVILEALGVDAGGFALLLRCGLVETWQGGARGGC